MKIKILSHFFYYCNENKLFKMKNALILLLLFISIVNNFTYSQIPIGNKIVPPTNVSSGYIHINAFSTIETAGNHNYNGNSNTLFEAGQTITLNPGF